MLTFQPGALRAVSHLIARRMGSDETEATEVADHLVRANLAGHDSHGVGMLPTYVRLLNDGLLVPNQTPGTVLDAGALLVIDARRGYGQRMTADAVRRAIGKAKEHGACVLALRNSAHVGRIGTYAELATGQGCAFTAFVNVADHRDVAATHGAMQPRLGTNPFCAAVPGPNGEPMLLDMATTKIAAGKARVAYNKGVTVPDDCLIDDAGAPTNDPTGYIRDHTGALKAFGLHKGSGLAVMCEIMATAVAGGATRAHVKSAKPIPGVSEVLTPGEPERLSAARRFAAGIEVDETSWSEIRAAALSLGVTEAEFDQASRANA
jgi:uncharacterized oxidoreductase